MVGSANKSINMFIGFIGSFEVINVIFTGTFAD